MSTKPLSFEEWYKIYHGVLPHDKDTCKRIFDAARRGLAGPPELVWEELEAPSRAQAKTPFGTYCSYNDTWSLWNNQPGRPCLEPCNSINNGKRQAQEHFESLWWSMSKPT